MAEGCEKLWSPGTSKLHRCHQTGEVGQCVAGKQTGELKGTLENYETLGTLSCGQ